MCDTSSILHDRSSFEHHVATPDASDYALFLDKISPFDYVSYEAAIFYDYDKIYDGLFRHELYTAWLEGTPWRRLRCHSPRRSGRTTFAAAIRHNLEGQHGRLALSIYFDVKDYQRHFTLLTSPEMSIREAFSRALLRQIVQRKLLLSQETVTFKAVQAGNIEVNTISQQGIDELIALETNHEREVFVVIDGRVECGTLESLQAHLGSIANVSFRMLTMEDSARFPAPETRWCDFCKPQKYIERYWQCSECPSYSGLEDYCFDCSRRRTCKSHILLEPYPDRVVGLRSDQFTMKEYVKRRLMRELVAKTHLGSQLDSDTIDETSTRVLRNTHGDFTLLRLNTEYIIEQQSLDETKGILSRLSKSKIEYFQSLLLDVTTSDRADAAVAAIFLNVRARRTGVYFDLHGLNAALARHFDNRDMIPFSEDDVGPATNGILTMDPLINDGRRYVRIMPTELLTFLNEECETWIEGLDTGTTNLKE